MTRTDDVRALFEASFGAEPAGEWSAPGRVNLIGEHTDYTGGFVMPLAIEQRAYIAASPREDRIVRAVAAGHPVQSVALDEVGRGRPGGWLGYLAGAAWVAERARGRVGSDHGWDLALLSDVPVGAGLSSSAAITCATLLALNDLDEWSVDRQELARWAQRVEHEVAGIPCGIMDQTASLQCTSGHVLFMDTRSQELVQVPWPAPETGFTLLVTNTNAPHMLVDGQYADRRRLCEEATALLGVPSLRDASLSDLEAAARELSADQEACARHVISENARVLRSRDLLESGRAMELGPELTASHASLRDDFRVTVPQLDCAVDAALAAGARGARMTGGGFGGCTIALVDVDGAPAVRSAIDRAFAEAGFASPEHFLATPSAGAHRER
jgi:galactokinase